MVYLQGPIPEEKREVDSHIRDAGKYITVPPIRRKEGVPKHPALMYPEWHKKMYIEEIQRLKRLTRVLMMALVLTSVGLVISLIIIGLSLTHWSTN